MQRLDLYQTYRDKQPKLKNRNAFFIAIGAVCFAYTSWIIGAALHFWGDYSLRNESQRHLELLKTQIKDMKHSKLNSEIESLQLEFDGIISVTSERSQALQGFRTYFNSENLLSSSYSNYFNSLAYTVPQGARVTRFLIENNALDLTFVGQANSPVIVSRLLQNIANNAHFRGKEFNFVTVDSTGLTNAAYQFSVSTTEVKTELEKTLDALGSKGNETTQLSNATP